MIYSLVIKMEWMPLLAQGLFLILYVLEFLPFSLSQLISSSHTALTSIPFPASLLGIQGMSCTIISAQKGHQQLIFLGNCLSFILHADGCKDCSCSGLHVGCTKIRIALGLPLVLREEQFKEGMKLHGTVAGHAGQQCAHSSNSTSQCFFTFLGYLEPEH